MVWSLVIVISVGLLLIFLHWIFIIYILQNIIKIKKFMASYDNTKAQGMPSSTR